MTIDTARAASLTARQARALDKLTHDDDHRIVSPDVRLMIRAALVRIQRRRSWRAYCASVTRAVMEHPDAVGQRLGHAGR